MSESSAMLRLAAPLALQQMGHHMMGLVDAAMLGHYSDTALAGAGVGNNLYFFITCVGLGIVMGMDTIVPQALGAGRSDEARRTLGAGLRLGLLLGLVTTLLVVASPFVLVLADVDADVIHEARAYTYMRALGATPFIVSIALRSYLAAHSVTRPLVLAVVVGNIVNAGLDLALIFGVPALGIPPMGVIGAALATTIVQVLMLIVFFLAVRAVERDALGPRPPSSRADMLAIVKYGGPVGGQLLAEVGIFGIATVMAARIGKVSAASHSIALNLSSLTFSFSLGIASATSVRVGHAVGAGDLSLARRRGLLGLRLGLVVMACFAAIFVAIPHTLASGFTNDATVVSATATLLYLAALFQLSDGAQAIGAGALRGVGANQATLFANLIGHYVIGLPLILGLAFAVGMGAPGLWTGLCVGLTVTAALLVIVFVRRTRTA